MTVVNTLFKTKKSHLFIYESDPSKAQVDYCFRRNQKKFTKTFKSTYWSVYPLAWTMDKWL